MCLHAYTEYIVADVSGAGGVSSFRSQWPMEHLKDVLRHLLDGRRRQRHRFLQQLLTFTAAVSAVLYFFQRVRNCDFESR